METLDQQSPVADTGASDDPTKDPTRAGEIEPTVTRGGNVVAVMPPSASYLTPTLSALSHRSGGKGLGLIILANEAMLDSVEQTLIRAWRDAAGTVLAARAAEPAAKLIRQDEVGALITSPDTALALMKVSSLPLDQAPTILMAWPETWEDDSALVGLMQDLPAEAQRVLYTAETARAERMCERYLRKALVVGSPPRGTPEKTIDGSVTVASGWGTDIGTAVRQTIERLAPASVSVWTATAESESSVRDALARTPRLVPVTLGDCHPAAVIVAADLPSPDGLVRLASAADRLVVLAPPWSLTYLGGHARSLQPLLLPGATDRIDREIARQHTRIGQVLETGGADLDRALHTLVPLFQQHDPAQVAAALYRLWTTEQPTGLEAPAPAATPPRRPTAGQTRPTGRGRSTKVFVTAGKKDGATPADFVALLTRDLKVPKDHIGKIELRETFSLIELPATEAPAVAEALNGRTIRRRQVVARLDRPRQTS